MISKTRHIIKRLLIRLGFYSSPDFLIIGAQKAGTTYLYSLLRQHPKIIEPVHKEAHFFEDDFSFNKGPFQYKLNFDLSFRFKAGDKTFEATPDYLPDFEAHKRIKKYYPKIKMLAILREPVSRSFSAWKMHHFLFKNHEKYSDLYDPRNFDEVIKDAFENLSYSRDKMNHIARSKYGEQLHHLLKYFDRDQILILFSDELTGNTQKTLDSICHFLDVDNLDLGNIDYQEERFWTNESAEKDLKISDEQRKKLSAYFREDLIKLNSLIKIPNNW